jgi:hypothetical protein
VAFHKGRYKVRFERQNLSGVTTYKEHSYDANDMPRLLKTASVVPGTKLDIYWPHERRYYTAMIKTEQPRKRENYLVCYTEVEARKKSSTNREWIDLHRHRFRIIAYQENEGVGDIVSNTVSTSHNLADTATVHPKEVVIVQKQDDSIVDREIDDAAVDSIRKIVSQRGDAVTAFASSDSKSNDRIRTCDTTLTQQNKIPAILADESHLPSATTIQSNVCAKYGQHEDDVFATLENSTSSFTGDESISVTFSSNELPLQLDAPQEPRSVVSMEISDLKSIVQSIDPITDSSNPNSERVSPCSTGTSRSIVQVSEYDVQSPVLTENSSVQQGYHGHIDDNFALRRVSENNSLVDAKSIQEDQNPLTNITKAQPNDTSTTSLRDCDVCATEKYLSTNDDNRTTVNNDDEGIVIDPDNDEATKTAICSLIDIGSRVAVFWELENSFFPGTITDRTFRGKPFFLKYDDGESEWIDLRKHRFRLLPPSSSSSSTSSDPIDIANNNTHRSTRRSSLSNVNGKSAHDKNNAQESTATSIVKKDYASSSKSLKIGADNAPTTRKWTERILRRSSLSKKNSTEEIKSDRLQFIPVKRSGPSTTKPNRFKELFDTSDSDDGFKPTIEKKKKIRRSRKSPQSDTNVANITVGTRVAILWEGDKHFYNAVVTRQRVRKKPFFVEYEDTDETEWVDFTSNTYKILPSTKDAVLDHKKAEQNLGSPTKSGNSGTEKRFRLGSPEKVSNRTPESDKKISNSPISTKKRKLIDMIDDKVASKRDDNVDSNDAGNNSDVSSFITVGTRVSVYWEGDGKYYDGIVSRERKNSDRKHYLEYDDGEAAHWIDFREHWVRILPDPKPTNSDKSDKKIPISKRQKLEKETISTQRSKRKTPDDKPNEMEKRSNVASKKNKIEIFKPNLHSKAKENASETGSNTVAKDQPKSNSSSKVKPIEVDNHVIPKKHKNANEKPTDDDPEFSDLALGSRVEIWWSGDKIYYKGTITKMGPVKYKKFYITYDDGEEAWVYLARNRVRLLNPSTNKNNNTKKSDVLTEKDGHGTKVRRKVISKKEEPDTKKRDKVMPTEVDANKLKNLSSNKVSAKDVTAKNVTAKNVSKKATGTSNNVVKKKVGRKPSTTNHNVIQKLDKASPKLDKVESNKVVSKKGVKPTVKKVESFSDDDDDDDDSNSSLSSSSSEDHMAYKDFVYGDVDMVQVGSRIAVWWPGNRRYYDGTIKKINTKYGCRRPYFIKYDDSDKEWTDLRRRYFRILD